MKRRYFSNLFSFVIAISTALSSSLGVAEEAPVFKVIKVKGRQAIVNFSSKTPPLKVGQILKGLPRVKGDSEVEAPSRNHFIGLETGFSSLTTKNTTAGSESKTDKFDINLTYGWNNDEIEYGILAKYSFMKEAATDTKTIELGGLFDFNFGPNTEEHDWVPGLRLVLAVGQQDNSAQTKAALTTRIEPDLFVKWFGLSTNLAAIGSLGYQNLSIALDDAKTTQNGLVGRLGIQAYF